MYDLLAKIVRIVGDSVRILAYTIYISHVLAYNIP